MRLGCADIASVAGALVLALAVAAGGCASPAKPPEPVAGAFAGNQGGSWEAVLAPGGVAAPAGEEAWRNDGALAVASPGSVLGSGAWPQEYRPSLDRVRNLFLFNQPNMVPYMSRYPLHRAPHRRPWIHVYP